MDAEAVQSQEYWQQSHSVHASEEQQQCCFAEQARVDLTGQPMEGLTRVRSWKRKPGSACKLIASGAHSALAGDGAAQLQRCALPSELLHDLTSSPHNVSMTISDQLMSQAGPKESVPYPKATESVTTSVSLIDPDVTLVSPDVKQVSLGIHADLSDILNWAGHLLSNGPDVSQILPESDNAVQDATDGLHEAVNWAAGLAHMSDLESLQAAMSDMRQQSAEMEQAPAEQTHTQKVVQSVGTDMQTMPVVRPTAHSNLLEADAAGSDDEHILTAASSTEAQSNLLLDPSASMAPVDPPVQELTHEFMLHLGLEYSSSGSESDMQDVRNQEYTMGYYGLFSDAAISTSQQLQHDGSGIADVGLLNEQVGINDQHKIGHAGMPSAQSDIQASDDASNTLPILLHELGLASCDTSVCSSPQTPCQQIISSQPGSSQVVWRNKSINEDKISGFMTDADPHPTPSRTRQRQTAQRKACKSQLSPLTRVSGHKNQSSKVKAVPEAVRRSAQTYVAGLTRALLASGLIDHTQLMKKKLFSSKPCKDGATDPADEKATNSIPPTHVKGLICEMLAMLQQHMPEQSNRESMLNSCQHNGLKNSSMDALHSSGTGASDNTHDKEVVAEGLTQGVADGLTDALCSVLPLLFSKGEQTAAAQANQQASTSHVPQLKVNRCVAVDGWTLASAQIHTPT